MANLGGFLPWGPALGNYPGDRMKLLPAHRQSQRAATVVKPGLGWENYGLGVVRSPLDGVRTQAQLKVVDYPDPSTSGVVTVAGV